MLYAFAKIAGKPYDPERSEPAPSLVIANDHFIKCPIPELMAENYEDYIEKRNALLKDIDIATIRKSWFTLAHLLLDEGAHVIDMGCGEGTMAYTMAVLEPLIKVTGVDKSKRRINKAKVTYKRPNLDFVVGDASSEVFEPESIDAIINSYTLHEVYSSSRYNPQIVSDTLRKQFRMLKKGGMMYIRDYARPTPGEMVLMEMPDKPSASGELAGLSESDLLVWYAENARPREDKGLGGFFLEEMPARFPGTRLFRLPYKWAYEFIMRKDDRSRWENELPIEYTFFTPREFRKELQNLGARVQYAAPYWDEDIIRDRFQGHFRLYNDNGTPLGNPPTCHLLIACKVADRKSLAIEERRPSPGESSDLKIRAMRNEKTGELIDVVSRDFDTVEIIPYRKGHGERLKIFLHEGVVRGIANAVPRSGINLDGKRWSGHMIEPICTSYETLSEFGDFDVKNTIRFSRDVLGLKPQDGAVLEHGPDYYPAPDYIDELIRTYYLKVENPGAPVTPKSFIGYSGNFSAKGKIREFDAQQVLHAIAVGLIPNARLELQILSLFQHLGMKAETWTDKQLNLHRGMAVQRMHVPDLLQALADDRPVFKEVKGTTGQLRTIHSTFVEQGQSKGSPIGLSAQNIDFVISDEYTINTAVIIPLTSDLKGMIHAGFQIKNLPVPQRHEGKPTMASAPSVNLPREITTIEEAKQFIADKFGVRPEMVFKLGESYFNHIGLTPQRIHPFAISAPPEMFKDPDTKFIPIYQYMLLWRSISKEPHFLTTLARVYRYYHEDMRLEAKREVREIVRQRFSQAQPDWSIPMSYILPPKLKRYERQKALAPPEDRPEAKSAPGQPETEKSVLAFHEREREEAVKKTQNTAPENAEAAPAPRETPASEFEQDLESFIDTMQQHEPPQDENGPVPEKW